MTLRLPSAHVNMSTNPAEASPGGGFDLLRRATQKMMYNRYVRAFITSLSGRLDVLPGPWSMVVYGRAHPAVLCQSSPCLSALSSACLYAHPSSRLTLSAPLFLGGAITPLVATLHCFAPLNLPCPSLDLGAVLSNAHCPSPGSWAGTLHASVSTGQRHGWLAQLAGHQTRPWSLDLGNAFACQSAAQHHRMLDQKYHMAAWQMAHQGPYTTYYIHSHAHKSPQQPNKPSGGTGPSPSNVQPMASSRTALSASKLHQVAAAALLCLVCGTC